MAVMFFSKMIVCFALFFTIFSNYLVPIYSYGTEFICTVMLTLVGVLASSVADDSWDCLKSRRMEAKRPCLPYLVTVFPIDFTAFFLIGLLLRMLIPEEFTSGLTLLWFAGGMSFFSIVVDHMFCGMFLKTWLPRYRFFGCFKTKPEDDLAELNLSELDDEDFY